MLAKIICIVIILVIHIGLAVTGFGIMLLSMNGYNDAAAEAAMPAYAFTQLLFAIILSVVAFFICWFFLDKLMWNVFISSLITVVITIAISVVLTFLAIGIGIGFGDMAFRR
jgi:cell division protein FtsW (lipid II flippase)